MKNNKIYEEVQTQVISDLLHRNDMNFFRKVCRWYSTTFHTPLHIVMDCREVQWDEILTHYYESQMEELGYNQIYDVATREYIPELAEQYEEENKEFAQALVKEQKETLKKAEAKKRASNSQKTIVSGAKKEEPKPDNKELPAPPPPMNLTFDDDEEI